MLKSELLEVIASGESSGVEFKRDDVRPEKLAKELVAFANVHGGRLLLGVEDDGRVSGLTRPDTEQWVMDTVFGRYIHPQILPFYEEVALGEDLRVAVITVQSGTTKPYVVRQNDREEIYVRVGSSSRLATREQQARLFAAGAMLHAETMPVSGTSLADLHSERIDNYLVDYAKDEAPPVDVQSRISRLEGLGFMTPGPNGHHLCTIAGLVLFGRSTRRAMPQGGVRWMAFDAEDKEYQALDDTYLDGPLVPLTREEGGVTADIEPGLIDRLVERMTPWISSEGAKVDETLRRRRHFDYPLAALREALVNALVHRDWTRGLEVEVVSYSDRLEITSPGALQNSMTVEKMLAGQRSPRNPILVEVCRDYGYVDARGMGVRRKIVPLVKDARFEATEDFLKVVLPRSSMTGSSSS